MNTLPQSPATHIANRRRHSSTGMDERHTPIATRLRSQSDVSPPHNHFLQTSLSFRHIFMSYLTEYAQDSISEMAESPAHMLVDIIMATDENALSRSSNLTDMQEFLSVYFVPDIVTEIVSYYEDLQHFSSVPPTYLMRCSLGQIGQSVAIELRSLSLDTEARFVRLDGGGGKGQGQGGGDGAGKAGNGGDGGDKDEGSGGADQGGGGGPGQGRRPGSGQGKRGGKRSAGSGRAPSDAQRPECQRFRNIRPTLIQVDNFLKKQKSSIHDLKAAKTFHLDPVAQRLQSKAYNPYEDISPDSTDKTRLLFHGTRKSCLNGFKYYGVFPRWKPNELSSGEAFYVTNSIEQAVAHVLYMCPKVVRSTADPITVLVFSVDCAVLHGDCPSPLDSSTTFFVDWFEHDDPEHRQEFIEFADHNLTLHAPSHDPSLDDIRIAPICLPGHTQSTILENWTTNQDISLTQVAACTQPAYNFFSSCLTEILEEKRV